jgi:tRNA modification GTPase
MAAITGRVGWMVYGLDDRRTIFALASGLGKAAIAVIRLSGPDSSLAIEALTGQLPQPRQASFRKIVDSADGRVIDGGLVLWFPGPNSFTGEDSGEFQVHGSPSVVSLLLRVLNRTPGMRLAKPGEFARRALENGKLDLVAVEALGDLIEAETEQQRRLAIEQACGNLQQAVELWRSDLLDSLVMIECDLDFSDEQDAPSASRANVRMKCEEILRSLAPLTAENLQVERIREGMTVLIAGPPNAGKSTLLNAITRRDVAIVSERAGTTRDLIEVRLDLGGFPVNLVDTAGIRESDDPVEREGVQRALKKSAAADLVLWLNPLGEPFHFPPDTLADRPLWCILTKADEAGDPGMKSEFPGNQALALDPAMADDLRIEISAKTGRNLDMLIKRLEGYARKSMFVEGSLIVANERQRSAICAAEVALRAALDESAPLEIVAEDLRRACFFLESLIGRVGVEDVLERIFARFCIGK